MMEFLNRAVKRAMNRIKLPFRALVESGSGALEYTLIQGLSRVRRNKVKAFQHYGLVSRLPAGTEVIVIPRLGRTEKIVIVSEGHKTAISLSEGDVALERESGEHVLLKAGEIVIKANSVQVAGTGGKALATEDLLTLFSAHVHAGVQTGGGNTSPPTISATIEKTIKTKAL